MDKLFHMTSKMSSAVLIDHDWLNIAQMDTEASSGYGSGSDDGGSLCSFPSASQEDLSGPARENDVMKFTSRDTLCDSLHYIMSMSELCDVTFIVGKKKQPIHGLRAIIASRSRAFYQLILKHTRTEQTGRKSMKSRKIANHKIIVPVLNYEVDVFRSLIQFIHCGTIRITLNTVTGLMCASDQFELEDLRRACWNYVEFSLQSKTAHHLLSQANKYSHHRAAHRIVSRIHRHYNSESIRHLKYGPRLETTV
ncbi:hypothetical protein ScPMuIL_016259 [Solemya velum]